MPHQTLSTRNDYEQKINISLALPPFKNGSYAPID